MSAPDAITPISAAATSVASHTRRSSQSQTPTTPTPASAGIEKPNVISRSAGNHPVSSPTGAPRITSAAHAASTRRAKPLGPHHAQRRQREREPLHVAGPPMQRTIEVRMPDVVGHAGTAEEPVLRRVDRQSRGTDRHREQAAREDRAATERGEGDPPRVAPPAALATRERPRGHSREHERADQEELRMCETTAAERDRGQDGAPRRAERQADRRRDERSGEREVREVPGREVHGEQPGEEPGEHPGSADPTTLSGHGARRADEHRRSRADHRAERCLEPGGDRGDG